MRRFEPTGAGYVTAGLVGWIWQPVTRNNEAIAVRNARVRTLNPAVLNMFIQAFA
jgi:hypothetical protein